MLFLGFCTVLGLCAWAVGGAGGFSCHTDLGESYDRFRERHAGWTHADAVDQLYQWCANDTACARSYHLDGAVAPDVDADNRRAAFGYLVEKWLPAGQEHGLASLLSDGVCRAGSLAGLLQHMWLLELRVQAYEKTRVRCGANERFVFDAEMFEGHCVCAEDRNCADAGDWRSSCWNYSTIAQVLTNFVLVLVFVVQFCATSSAIRTFHHIRRLKDADKARAEFAKALRK